METQKYTVLRVRKTTRDTLKLVSVLSHESMGQTIEQLARQELARIQKRQGKPEGYHESFARDQIKCYARTRGVLPQSLRREKTRL